MNEYFPDGYLQQDREGKLALLSDEHKALFLRIEKDFIIRDKATKRANDKFFREHGRSGFKD